MLIIRLPRKIGESVFVKDKMWKINLRDKQALLIHNTHILGPNFIKPLDDFKSMQIVFVAENICRVENLIGHLNISEDNFFVDLAKPRDPVWTRFNNWIAERFGSRH